MKYKPKNSSIIILVIFFVLIISFIFDKTILNFVVTHRIHFLDVFMVLINVSLSEIALFLLLTLLFFYIKDLRKHIPLLWLSMLLALIISALLKILVERQRPDVSTLIAVSSFSFPSGHTTVAFSAVPLIQRVFKKLKWFWIGLAIIIALSRVYVGVHYLSDILAGGIIGYVTGYSALKLYSKFLKNKNNLSI